MWSCRSCIAHVSSVSAYNVNARSGNKVFVLFEVVCDTLRDGDLVDIDTSQCIEISIFDIRHVSDERFEGTIALSG